MKDIIILGGSNGAGKTTAAQVVVPKELQIREFVNADEIARGLSPFNVEGVAVAAGRLMIERMRSLAGDGESFAFETTCAGRRHATSPRRRKAEGCRITLLYLWLPTIEMAQARVARRVSEGGHQIPPEVVARRYVAGLKNMRRLYLPLADFAAIYDNSDGARTLIAELTGDTRFVVHNPARWAAIEEATR